MDEPLVKYKPVKQQKEYKTIINDLQPYQKYIYNNAQIFDTRTINMIYYDKDCKDHFQGLGHVQSLCEMHKNGIVIPHANIEHNKLMLSCYTICSSQNLHHPSAIFIDLSYFKNTEIINDIYADIERIKDGLLHSTINYSHKFYIDSPAMWIFQKTPPDEFMLTWDRMKIWTIDENKTLQPYVA